MSDPTGPSSRTSTDLPAPPDEVWETLTSPEGVEEWLGDGSTLTPVEGSELDVADVETGVRRHGRVEEAVPSRRLGFVWWPASDDPDAGSASRVAIELAPHGDGTRFVVTETPLSPVAGTHRALACLDAAWTWRSAWVELSILGARHAGSLTVRC